MLKSKARPVSRGPLPPPPWRRKTSTGPPDNFSRGSTDPPPPPKARLLEAPDPHKQRRTVTHEVDDDEAERDRQSEIAARRAATNRARGTAVNRATTAKSSSEEWRARKHQREAATASQKPGGATKHLTFATKCPAHIALLTGDEAATAMRSKPKRLPDLILQSPHEAVPSFHEDWTLVEGSDIDPEKWETELRRRDSRNRLIVEYLVDGRSVFYKSSGNSMWPLVQSGDACTFHPIQAVTVMDNMHAVQKERSEIDVGDIVFCQVQRGRQYYAHIVLRIEQDFHAHELKYWIGNIESRINGWCFREHIYGILVEVQTQWEGQLHTRPFHKSVFGQVQALVKDHRWSSYARSLCDPLWPE